MLMSAPERPSPAPELDELSLARAQRGDPQAFRRLVEVYQDRVFAAVGRIAARHAVEDIAQETFLKVHGALPSFDRAGTARLSTWIITIAARTALDQLRREKRWLRVPSGSATTSSRGEARALMRQVDAAMAHLSPEHRAVLVLRAYHDLDYDEIALALGLTEGTVKSRLARARAALRRALEPRRFRRKGGEESS